jgi:hypothetical protein
MSNTCQQCGVDVIDSILCRSCYAEWQEKRRKETQKPMGNKLYNVGALWSSKKPGGLPSGSIDLDKLEKALGELAGQGGKKTKVRAIILHNRFKEPGDKKPEYDLVITQDERDPGVKDGGFTKDPEDDMPF